MSALATYATTRGAVFVHSAPAALCPHIKWAMETVLGPQVRLDWTPQPQESPLLRTEAGWTGEPGTGARLATALRTCQELRYEVVEEPSPGFDGARFTYTPRLGVHQSIVSVNGDQLVTENRLRAVLEAGDPVSLRQAVEQAIGTPWDDELEPFRHAGEGAPVRWLHRVS